MAGTVAIGGNAEESAGDEAVLGVSKDFGLVSKAMSATTLAPLS